MKVTSLEKQKKNPKRYNIFLDGQFGFGADEDLVVKFRLLPGKEIFPTDLEKLLYEAEVGKLMERMYRLFSIRQRTEQEIRSYLKQLSYKRKIKGEEEISGVIIEQLLERIKQKGLVDDLEFARSWVDARRKSKQKGPRALKAELMQKGVNRKIIEIVLNDNSEGDEKLAKEALEKKLRIWKNLSPLEFRKKATDYLLRKGFDYSLVKGLVEKILKKDYNTF